MKIKLTIILFSVLWPSFLTAESLRVVTTLPVYADIAKQIGGDALTVDYVAPPRFNPHFVEPRPSDVLRLKRADLFIHSGLDYELWRYPLADAAGRTELRPGGNRELDLSRFVQLLEIPQGAVSRAQGDIHIFGNPHYTLAPRNGRAIAVAIQQKLSEVDPARSKTFETNLNNWLERLSAKEQSWQELLPKFAGQYAVGYHNDWAYLAKYSGLTIEQFLEPKPGIPPSPQHLAELQKYFQSNKVRGILQASFYPTESSHELAQRTGTKVLILCQNVGELPECGDYISMLDYDLRLLAREY